MHVSPKGVDEVCIEGDARLGGRDWDTRVVNFLVQQWQAEHNPEENPLDDPETAVELTHKAETAKKQLSSKDETKITFKHTDAKTTVLLDRTKFNALTADLLERTVTLTHQALAEAKKMKGNELKIDLILLVGGSSYMPQIQERLEQEFPGTAQKLFEPEQAVAKGAAIYASDAQIKILYQEAVKKHLGGKATKEQQENPDILPPEVKDEIIREVEGALPPTRPTKFTEQAIVTRIRPACSKNFGIAAVNTRGERFVSYIIPRNSMVPASIEKTYYTQHDGQDDANIEVFETNGINPATDPEHPSCRKIKEFTLNLPPNLPANHPIVVRFGLSEDGGQLRVQARDPNSGSAIDETVDSCDSLMDHEVKEMSERMRDVNLQ
jgi:molecular chaperone DnaK